MDDYVDEKEFKFMEKIMNKIPIWGICLLGILCSLLCYYLSIFELSKAFFHVLMVIYFFKLILGNKVVEFDDNLKIEAENYCGEDCKLKYLTQSSYVCYDMPGGLIDDRVFCNYYHFYDLKLKKNIYVVERFKNDTEFYEDTLPEYILNDE